MVDRFQVIAMRRVWEEVDAKRLRSLLSGSCLRYFIFVSAPDSVPKWPVAVRRCGNSNSALQRPGGPGKRLELSAMAEDRSSFTSLRCTIRSLRCPRSLCVRVSRHAPAGSVPHPSPPSPNNFACCAQHWQQQQPIQIPHRVAPTSSAPPLLCADSGMPLMP